MSSLPKSIVNAEKIKRTANNPGVSFSAFVDGYWNSINAHDFHQALYGDHFEKDEEASIGKDYVLKKKRDW